MLWLSAPYFSTSDPRHLSKCCITRPSPKEEEFIWNIVRYLSVDLDDLPWKGSTSLSYQQSQQFFQIFRRKCNNWTLFPWILFLLFTETKTLWLHFLYSTALKPKFSESVEIHKLSEQFLMVNVEVRCFFLFIKVWQK